MRDAPIAESQRLPVRAARRRAQDGGVRAAVRLRPARRARSTRTSRAWACACDLLEPGAPFEALHDQMLAITPPGAELEFHVNLLRHGRRTCHCPAPGLPGVRAAADVPVGAGVSLPVRGGAAEDRPRPIRHSLHAEARRAAAAQHDHCRAEHEGGEQGGLDDRGGAPVGRRAVVRRGRRVRRASASRPGTRRRSARRTGAPGSPLESGWLAMNAACSWPSVSVTTWTPLGVGWRAASPRGAWGAGTLEVAPVLQRVRGVAVRHALRLRRRAEVALVLQRVLRCCRR